MADTTDPREPNRTATDPAPPARLHLDRVSRACLLVITAALTWLAATATVGVPLAPSRAEAQRETVSVNLERIGGRYLSGGTVPIRCADLRP
jgi:hypothetical protein